jgi:hypothetical protein
LQYLTSLQAEHDLRLAEALPQEAGRRYGVMMMYDVLRVYPLTDEERPDHDDRY